MDRLEAWRVFQRSKRALFTFADVKRLLHLELDNSVYRAVSRLIKASVLTRIIKGVYRLVDSNPTEFEIASFLYRPSYVSFASALNYYGVVTQTPYIVSSVTTRRPRKFIINGKEFSYSHLNPKYFFGYQKEGNFLIATAEKALLDSLFFAGLGKKSFYKELNWELVNRKELQILSKKFTNKAFQKLMRTIGKL